MRYSRGMKTKQLTFLLVLTLMFLFSGSVLGDDFKDGGHKKTSTTLTSSGGLFGNTYLRLIVIMTNSLFICVP